MSVFDGLGDDNALAGSQSVSLDDDGSTHLVDIRMSGSFIVGR